MGIRFFTAGESHGAGLVVILEGIPAGLNIAEEKINLELARRKRGFGSGPRAKLEQDCVQILGGVMENHTTGAPIAMLIENKDHKNWSGREVEAFKIPRPGHADLVGAVKYNYSDLRPALERASARETAARVAMGAVCKLFLERFGIAVGGYVISIGEVEAKIDDISFENRIIQSNSSRVGCPDKEASELMEASIQEIIAAKDTLGGIIEIIALGVPAGLGSYSQWDKRLDARLAMAILSVQAIKGIEIGRAFENTRKRGTTVQDEIYLENERLIRKTNHAGGIEAGITNGLPLILRAAMKPIATTLKPLRSVDLAAGLESPTQYERSDFCPVPRAIVILEAMVAYVVADALMEKLGGDSIDEMLPRFKKLKRANLSDIHIDGKKHSFWV